MILLEEAEVYDIFTFINRFGFQLIEFVVIVALAVLAIVLGAKLRKATDKIKANKAAKLEAEENVVNDTTKKDE